VCLLCVCDLSNSFRHWIVNLLTRFVVICVHEDVYFELGTLHPVQTDLTRPDKMGDEKIFNLRHSTSCNRELFQSQRRAASFSSNLVRYANTLFYHEVYYLHRASYSKVS